MNGKQMIESYLHNGWVMIGFKGTHCKIARKSFIVVIPCSSEELSLGMEAKLCNRIREVG